MIAGFDNCHYDTYQKQLERLMEPVWEAAGVAFEVRNAGEGGDCGDSVDKQVWCLRRLVGDDVDMIHYSWTYFEAGAAPGLAAVKPAGPDPTMMTFSVIVFFRFAFTYRPHKRTTHHK